MTWPFEVMMLMHYEAESDEDPADLHREPDQKEVLPAADLHPKPDEEEVLLSTDLHPEPEPDEDHADLLPPASPRSSSFSILSKTSSRNY